MSSDESKSSGVRVADVAPRVAAMTVVDTYADAKAASGESGVVVATHSGSFHCDEALALGLLTMLPEYASAAIVRTRNADDIEKADVAVDVGGVYDFATKRFDHHQRSFSGTMKAELGYDIKLSSAGLVYRHFGRQVIAVVAPGLDEATVELLYTKVYKNFIREVDAIDNGVNICGEDDMKYTIKTGLSSRVSFLNPSWNEDVDSAGVNDRFKAAVTMTTEEFVGAVRRLVDHWLPAREIVEASYKARLEVHPSGRIMKLGGHCPWKSHLYDIEDEAKARGEDVTELYYVLYPDQRGAWRIQCVSVSPSSFVNRKSLPEPWQGVRGEELSTLCGIPGCIFIHANGFIGGNETYEGALKMAVAAVEFTADQDAAM